MEGIQRKSFRIVNLRAAVLIALVIIPLLVYAVVGTYALWKTNLLIWLWWLVPAFWLITWLVAWVWKPSHIRSNPVMTAEHWTPRDQAAAEIVRKYQRQVDQYSNKQMSDVHFYLTQVQALAKEMADHYHPNAADPVSSLTVPEILAATRLVADDLEHLVLNSVPGSRMLTVQQWKSLQHAPKWMKRIRNTAWAASMFLNPLNIARFGAAKATIEPVTSGVQTQLLTTVYLRLMEQVGFYLIEMNSGRLRGGADAYRKAFDRESPGAEQPTARADANAENVPKDEASNQEGTNQSTVPINNVTVGLIGQVSSGKSSLINQIMGTRTAEVDLLPETSQVKRYHWAVGDEDDSSAELVFLDSPGYAQTGASAAQIGQIQTALRESDLVLLVMDAHTPARDADKETLKELMVWYAENPRLKPPVILGVLTHVDLLSPVMSWAPPYDWKHPSSKKGASIAEAVKYTLEVFDGLIEDVIPVCADETPERVWGVVDFLLPAIIERLDDAKSISVLQAFERQLDANSPVKILLNQAKSSGKQLLKTWLNKKLDQLNTVRKKDERQK